MSEWPGIVNILYDDDEIRETRGTEEHSKYTPKQHQRQQQPSPASNTFSFIPLDDTLVSLCRAAAAIGRRILNAVQTVC